MEGQIDLFGGVEIKRSKKKKLIMPDVGATVYRVVENFTCGPHNIIKPPEGYECRYKIVEGTVKAPYYFNNGSVGFSAVYKKCGACNLGYHRPETLGKSVFTDYESCVTHADNLVDNISHSFLKQKPIYRPWRNDGK